MLLLAAKVLKLGVPLRLMRDIYLQDVCFDLCGQLPTVRETYFLASTNWIPP